MTHTNGTEESLNRIVARRMAEDAEVRAAERARIVAAIREEFNYNPNVSAEELISIIENLDE